jgi:glucose-6-phosphate-specific signal transduction histidine kinase
MTADSHLASCGSSRLLRKMVAVNIAPSFAAQPKWLIVGEMACLIGLIGIGDYATSWELSLFVFYGLPIFVAAWLVHRHAGFALAALACAVWFFANLPTHPYKTQEGYFWAGINRLFYFGFVAVGGAAMRHQRDQSRERIEALTLARNLELEVVRAGEREQVRIGQDLHDGVCQNLAAIDCATECLKEDLASAGLPQAAMAGKIQQFLKETIVDARNLARGIFPVQVESDGLESALNELATKAGFVRDGTVVFESSGDVRIEEPQVAMHLYRIAQEAMSNATRHANASRITLQLSRQGPRVVLTISDNGRGFQARANSAQGLGLRTMRYRAELIGASIAIRSEPGSGTVVECALHLPVSESSPTVASISS